MNLLLPREVRAQLKAELRRAGDREIGGFLMAEQLAPGEFRIVNITVDPCGRDGNTFPQTNPTASGAAAEILLRYWAGFCSL